MLWLGEESPAEAKAALHGQLLAHENEQIKDRNWDVYSSNMVNKQISFFTLDNCTFLDCQIFIEISGERRMTVTESFVK
ncbi:hypothetical protein DV515_00008596 [Chloebia gouldiae]|uniref:Uncharacterized protein n=1 Tax=Chloebia gouldiae TaxID=44316 RepID=A0A3L8SFC3_CHLGU|nr:hypothetical protein DV515_00008596 [Chloebia gouldiae]